MIYRLAIVDARRQLISQPAREGLTGRSEDALGCVQLDISKDYLSVHNVH